MGRKGELSAVAIDRGWPHQVVVPARLCERDGYNEIHDVLSRLDTLLSRPCALPTASGFTVDRTEGAERAHVCRAPSPSKIKAPPPLIISGLPVVLSGVLMLLWSKLPLAALLRGSSCGLPPNNQA